MTDKKAILNLLENELEFDANEFEFGDHEYLRSYEIQQDGAVNLDFAGDGQLDLHRFTKDGKLVIKFDKIRGDAFAEFEKGFGFWKSFDGFPMTIYGSLHAINSGITSYTALPKICTKTIFARLNPITSLVGAADHFENIRILDLSMDRIKEGGIGLLLIPNLFQLMNNGIFTGTISKDKLKWCDIVQKYLGQPDRIFECQTELIDAGFEEHARL